MAKGNIFADTIVNISVMRGVVRLDLGPIEEPSKDGKEAKVSVTDRLVMPIEGFAASFRMQEAAVKRMVELRNAAQAKRAAKGEGEAAAPAKKG